MTKARVLMNQVLVLNNELFKAHLKVYEVPKSIRFPDGIKVRCALVEKATGRLRVLLDNHHPYGYHLHTKLSENKNFRTTISIRKWSDAVILFLNEVERVTNEE